MPDELHDLYFGMFKIKFRDQGIARIHRIVSHKMDVHGRLLYLIDDEQQYINHDNIIWFKKLETT